jgi:hypothetical protein
VQNRSYGAHSPRAGEDRSRPLDKLPKELWSMIFGHLDLKAAIKFSQTSKGNYARITNDPASLATHYAATLRHLRHVDLVLGGSILGLSKGLPTLLPKLSAAQGVGILHALSAAALTIQDEKSRALGITGVAKGLAAFAASDHDAFRAWCQERYRSCDQNSAVEDPQARLEHFDVLKDAALAIQKEEFRALAIAGVAKGLGTVNDAQARLERFDALKDAALAIHHENSRASGIGRLAKGLGAVEDTQARLERFDALNDAVLAIHHEYSRSEAISRLAKGLEAVKGLGAARGCASSARAL